MAYPSIWLFLLFAIPSYVNGGMVKLDHPYPRRPRSASYATIDTGSSSPTGNNTRIINQSLIKWRIRRYPNQKNLNDEDVNKIFVKAFQSWSDIASVDFKQVLSGSEYADVDVDITFMPDSYDFVCQTTMSTTSNLAHTVTEYQMVKMHMNGGVTWLADNHTGKIIKKPKSMPARVFFQIALIVSIYLPLPLTKSVTP